MENNYNTDNITGGGPKGPKKSLKELVKEVGEQDKAKQQEEEDNPSPSVISSSITPASSAKASGLKTSGLKASDIGSISFGKPLSRSPSIETQSNISDLGEGGNEPSSTRSISSSSSSTIPSGSSDISESETIRSSSSGTGSRYSGSSMKSSSSYASTPSIISSSTSTPSTSTPSILSSSTTSGITPSAPPGATPGATSGSTPGTTPGATISKEVIPSSIASTDQKGKKEKSKDPNSIIFYLDTNVYSLTFTPQMLVPGVSSSVVFIDTSYEYSNNGITELPLDAPKETVLTQFFLANQFELMKKRTLGNIFEMQKKLTYKEAKEDGVIDTNIELTVNTLFKDNNIIYINNKPYTIIKHKYRKGNWETDIKPTEQLVGISTDITQAEKEAKEELKSIDDSLLYGSASARGKREKNELKQKIQEQKLQEEEQLARPIRSFIQSTRKLQTLPAFLDYLLGTGLSKNDPINFEATKGRMNPCDPITFSLVIGLKDDIFVNYITSIDETDDGMNAYNNYADTKDKLLKKTQDFFSIISENFNPILDEYNDLYKSIQQTIGNRNRDLTNIDLTQTKKRILQIVEKKKGYMYNIKKLSEILIEIFKLQKPYFESVVKILNYIKTNYVKMIGYKKSQYAPLADKCIDYDLNVFSALSGNTSNSTLLDKYEQMYENNITAYISKHAKWFDIDYETEFEKKGPTINVGSEIDKYHNNPRLFYIEKKQYEIYLLIIMYHCFVNQADIWKIYFEMLPDFITSVTNETKTKVSNLQTELTNYNNFVNKLGEDNKPVLEEKTMLENYNKIMNEGPNFGANYDLYSLTKKESFLSKKNNVSEQEKRFINLKEREIDVYESIILFTNLLELRCLRQNYVYASESNIFVIQKEIAITFDYYYGSILNSIREGAIFTLPRSLMWSTNELNNQLNEDFIISKINSNELTERLYRQKQLIIENLMEDLKKYCASIHKLIEPIMDADGITQVCRVFQSPSGIGSSLLIDLLNFPLYETKLWKWELDKNLNINIDLSEALNSQIARVYKWSQTKGVVIDNNNDNKQDIFKQDWVVLNNFPDNANINTLLNEIDITNAQAKLDRIKALLKCEMIIFEMSDKNNGELNYDTSSSSVMKGVMKGGAGFSIYSEITKSLKLECDNLNFSEGNNYLFLLKIVDTTIEIETSPNIKYKLVYNLNIKPDSNYLYSYKTIKEEMEYIYLFITEKCIEKGNGDTVSSTDVTGMGLRVSKQIHDKDTAEEEKRQREIQNEEDRPTIVQSVSLLERKSSDLDDETLKKTRAGLLAQITKRSKKINSLKESNASEAHTLLNQLQSEVKDYNLKLANAENEMRKRNIPIPMSANAKKQQKGVSFQTVQKGGEISQRDRYYLTQGVQGLQTPNINYPQLQTLYPYAQQQALYPYAQQPMYPYTQVQQPLYPRINPVRPFIPQRQLSMYGQSALNPLQQYNYERQVSYLNKALELESKLAFYVNVELTLFPGTSVTTLQKTSALCSANFNEIRKSIAEIFGLQYFQAPIDDAYIYETKTSSSTNPSISRNVYNAKPTNFSNKYNYKSNENIGKRGGTLKHLKIKKNMSKRRKTYKN